MDNSTNSLHADPIGLVRSAWRDTLGFDTPNDDISFFDAGGDSFALITLIEKIKKSSGLTIKSVDVLRAPTMRSQAALLGQLMRDGDGERP
jgi:acyl carrier protein